VKRALLPLAFALLAGFATRVPAQVQVPKFEAPVVDLTGTLTAQQQAALIEKLNQFQARKGAQIAILMLPTTAPEDIAQFGIRLADAWKVGRKAPDDGAILIIAKDDREMRIEAGYGLEGAVTDALSNRIIEDTIAPLFKQGDFYGGVNAGLDQLIRVIDGEPLPEPDTTWKLSDRGHVPWTFLLFAFLFFGGMLNRVFGRVGGASVAGLIGGGVVWWLTSRLMFAATGFVGLFLLGLLFGGVGGSGIGGRGGRGVFRDLGRGGGFGGFGGGFGGGGGGFGGGGGGSFGGGGASGRW
jgi:uncharacterized protein